MFSFLISFLFGMIFTTLIIKASKKYKTALDKDLLGVQKVHSRIVPRIGGLAVFCAVVLTGAITIWRLPSIGKPSTLLLLCSAVAFSGGIVEDFTQKVSASVRLVLTLVAALMGYVFIGARITHINIPFVDWCLQYAWISVPLTVLMVAGIANSINLIDGFNGLASVVCIIMLMSLAYVALQVGDTFVLTISLLVAGATTGFLIWNYPAGLIFLGDGGAYFLGFILAELAVLLVARNPQVSPWYAALLLIYPAFETAFSVYRRFYLRGRSPGMPDGIHLHSLIFRRLVTWAAGERDGQAITRRNSMTSPYLWLLSLMAVGPATLFWRHTWLLILLCALFVVSYIWLYARIVRFRSPRWLIIERKNLKDKH
jgi:UDP-N-acetylmuramyl pentapeptide phosphotransferase/UDP-N-acetylglucosamine-1-phosphate transferase